MTLDHSLSADDKEAASSRLHDELIVVDALNCGVINEDQLRRLRTAGVTAINATLTCFEGFHETVLLMADMDRLITNHPDLALKVDGADDIVRAKREGKVGIIYGTQNASPIESDLRHVGALRSLGMRIIQLTYQTRNLVADGCLEQTNGGLTRFGREVVRELNRARILIDLSHVGDLATLQTIDASEVPVAITHACTRAVFEHPRNKPDEAIKRMAERGGMFGVAAYPFLVAPENPTLDQVIDHLVHVCGLIGPQRVGIGLDFSEGQPKEWLDTDRWGGSTTGRQRWMYGSDEWPRMYPTGLGEVTAIPNLTEQLLARGFSKEEIAGIMGRNWLRFFGEIW